MINLNYIISKGGCCKRNHYEFSFSPRCKILYESSNSSKTFTPTTSIIKFRYRDPFLTQSFAVEFNMLKRIYYLSWIDCKIQCTKSDFEKYFPDNALKKLLDN